MNSTITLSVTTLLILLMSSCSQTQEEKLIEGRKKLYKDLEITSELSSVHDSTKEFYIQEHIQKHGERPNMFTDVIYMDMVTKESVYTQTTLRILQDINRVDDKLREIELGLE
jgi:hypothetical protein